MVVKLRAVLGAPWLYANMSVTGMLTRCAGQLGSVMQPSGAGCQMGVVVYSLLIFYFY